MRTVEAVLYDVPLVTPELSIVSVVDAADTPFIMDDAALALAALLELGFTSEEVVAF